MAEYNVMYATDQTRANARAPLMAGGVPRMQFWPATGNYTVTDANEADSWLESWAHFAKYRVTKRAIDIACFGDSLTNGAGSTTTEKPYWANLDRLFGYARSCFNGGYNGGTSTVIRGVFDANSNQWPAITVIWAGNNNVLTDENTTQSKIDVAYMISTVAHGNYVVIGNITGKWGAAYEQGGHVWNRVAALNEYWAGLYGNRFLDIYPILRSNGNGGTQDSADIAKGQVPTSLCSDEIHLNDAGYATVANAVYAKLVALGY